MAGSGKPQSMDELIAYRQDLLSALERDIEHLARCEASSSYDSWYKRAGATPHTPHYTLFHLRTLEAQEFAVQISRILNEDMPELALFDDHTWLADYYTVGETPQAIVQDFSILRRLEIEMLNQLSAPAWSRSARHPWWGVHTLQWWVELQHDVSRQQIQELNRLLAV